MTESERLFEYFCIIRKLLFDRVKECSSPSADYWLLFNDYKIIAEIKQFEPNKEEKEVLRKPIEEWDQYDVFHWGIPGDRIRKKSSQQCHNYKHFHKEFFLHWLFSTTI